jgi:hypothetical protein
MLLVGWFGLVSACTVTDPSGASCPASESLFDGVDRWCVQADAPSRCEEFVHREALFLRRCAGATQSTDVLEAQLLAAVGCDTVQVIFPNMDDCMDALRDPTCPDGDTPPAACEAVMF